MTSVCVRVCKRVRARLCVYGCGDQMMMMMMIYFDSEQITNGNQL